MAVDAEFAAYGAADVDVAALLHVGAYVLAAQADGVEADVVDLRRGQSVVFEISSFLFLPLKKIFGKL